MTQEQKEKLSFQVVMHQPLHSAYAKIRFLNDGNIIQFTKTTNSFKNSEYEINNNPNWKIWYSQLANPFFDEDLNLWFATIEFRDGSKYEFRSLDSLDLYNMCKGKKFRVSINNNLKYIFNKDSKTAENKNLYEYIDIYEYIIQCIKRNRFEDIGDLLRTANAYSLKEI